MNCVSHEKKTPLFSLKSLMPFGKYTGRSVEDIISRDPNYVAWAIDNIGDFTLDEEAHIAYKQKRFW